MRLRLSFLLAFLVPLGAMNPVAADGSADGVTAAGGQTRPGASAGAPSDSSPSSSEVRIPRVQQEFRYQLQMEGKWPRGLSDWHSRDAWRAVSFTDDERGVPSLSTSTTVFVWPLVAGGGLSSPPGPRRHPITGGFSCHYGQDLDVPMGTPVRAIADGRAIEWDLGGAAGLTVTLDHGGGLTSSYAHLSSRAVEIGQQVVAGETVGKVGSSGASTGSHLHFEIRYRGTQFEPIAWFNGYAVAIDC